MSGDTRRDGMKDKAVKVSAIITCFNVEEYVAVAIQSVLDCGFSDLELIVVDDCSTDKTRAVIEMYEKQDLGIKFVPVYFPKNTVGGVATAANTGLDMATGDVILFIDGDDWVIPDATRRAVDALESSKADFVVTDCREYWNHTGEYSQYPEQHYWDQVRDVKNLEQRRDILIKMAPFPWRKIYSRSFLEDNAIRFPVGDFFFEDNPFHWETTIKAKSFIFFEEITHVHRMERPGQTIGQKGAKFLKIFDHAIIIKEKLETTQLHGRHHFSYAHWLLKHVVWCSTYVPPGFLNEVFERAKPLLMSLPPDIFWHEIATSIHNASDMRKLAAIYLDERFEFFREF